LTRNKKQKENHPPSHTKKQPLTARKREGNIVIIMEVEATKATNNDPYVTVAAAVETATPACATTTTTSAAVATATGHNVGGGDNPGTTEKLLAWLGCLIVNAAFISFIIFWIATDRWWIGFVVSMLYTTLLFGLAHAWSEDEDPKNKWRRCFWFCSSPPSTLAAEEENEFMASPPPPRRRPRMLVTLLYGLAVLSLGGTGMLLALNAIECHSINDYDNDDGYSTTPPYPPPFTWTTNLTSLPASVQSWAATPATTTLPPRGATFLHLPGSGITLFDEESPDGDMFVSYDNPWSVSNNDNNNSIWSVAPTLNIGQPVQLHDYPGHEFVLIQSNNNNNNETTTGCFATTTAGSTNPNSFLAYRRVPTVACTDGRTVRFVDIATYSSGGAPIEVHVDPRDLMVDNGLVWYKDHPPLVLDSSDTLIYSLDPITMIETQHSQQRSNAIAVVDNNDVDDENDADDDDTSCRRKVATTSLFLAALPVTFLSIYLWYRRHIPSMGISVFGGIIGTAWCIFFIAVGSTDWLEDYAYDFSNWLLLSLGALWMIFTTNGILSLSSSRASSSSQQYKVAPMRWGLNIGALAFFVGSFQVLDLIYGFFSGLFDHDHDVPESVRWILFNVAVLAPTCLLGLATQSSLLLVLTAAGLVFDALRLSLAITRPMDDGSSVALVNFVVLGCTGLAIAVLGWWTSRRQGQLAERFSSYLAPYTWWPSPRSATTTAADRRQQQPDDDGTKSTTTKVATLSAADNVSPTPRNVLSPPEAAPPTSIATAANEETTA
jgi:hypothetical protein